jgi:hypothetical protein
MFWVTSFSIFGPTNEGDDGPWVARVSYLPLIQITILFSHHWFTSHVEFLEPKVEPIHMGWGYLGPLSMGGSNVQIPRNQFGLIWSKLNPWVGPFLLNPSLHLGSPNHELSCRGWDLMDRVLFSPLNWIIAFMKAKF